jgi:AAA domain
VTTCANPASEQQKAFLESLIDPAIGCMELRILDADMERDGTIVKGGRFKGTYGGWSIDPTLIARWGSKLSGVSAFVTANPVNRALMARSNKLEKQKNTTSDADIVCLRWAFIDIDPKRPAGISATEEERQASFDCREKILSDHDSIRASAIFGCSGNGSWVLIRLPDYPNDEEHGAIVERFLKALAARYSGDYRGVNVEIDSATVNASRVMPFVGTFKCKGVDTPDRPHRLVSLDSPLATRPAPFDLKTWLSLHAPEEQPSSHKANGKSAWTMTVPSGSGAFPKPGVTVFDDFSAKTDWFNREMFAGIRVDKTLPNGEMQLTRPGKGNDVSGTIGHEGRDVFKCFSSNWSPFEAGGCYSKFQVYALLQHSGDHGKAAAELSARGFGTYIDHDGSQKKNPPPANWSKNKTANNSGGKSSSAKQQSELDKKIEKHLAGYKPTSFGQVEKNIGQLTHLWKNWLIIGNLALIYSKPKQGKTRIYIRWIKTLWNAEDWPDDAKNIWPAGSKTLVLPYDRNHLEIAAEMRALGIPDQAAVLPHDPRDASGVSLLNIDDPLMLGILDKSLSDDDAIKLIVVDTLTYASGKSLSKPEDMKVILDSIMALAAKHGVAVLVLIHENRDGEALGRRICERARVLMRLERYSESDPTRLRLYVKESNFKERPALTIVHTDAGVEFEKESGQSGIVADRRDACARWLCEYLWKRGVNVEIAFGTLIDEAGRAGFAGSYDSVANRWSDRKLFSRAIEGLNNESESLADLEHFKIRRREAPAAGRSKPIIWYWLEAAAFQPSGGTK